MCSHIHKEQGFTDTLEPNLQGVQTMKVLYRKLEPWPHVSPPRPGNRLYSLTVEPSHLVDSRSALWNPSVRTSSCSNSLGDGAFFPHPPIRLHLPPSLCPFLPLCLLLSLPPSSLIQSVELWRTKCSETCKVGVYSTWCCFACTAWSQDAGEGLRCRGKFKGPRGNRRILGCSHEVVSESTTG